LRHAKADDTAQLCPNEDFERQDVLPLPLHSLGKAFQRGNGHRPFPQPVVEHCRRVLRRASSFAIRSGKTRKGFLHCAGDRRVRCGARGVRCDAEQIIVTSGAQQALDLTSRLLLDPGDSAWLEDPGIPERCVRSSRRGKITACASGPRGIDVKWGQRHASGPDLLT